MSERPERVSPAPQPALDRTQTPSEDAQWRWSSEEPIGRHGKIEIAERAARQAGQRHRLAEKPLLLGPLDDSLAEDAELGEIVLALKRPGAGATAGKPLLALRFGFRSLGRKGRPIGAKPADALNWPGLASAALMAGEWLPRRGRPVSRMIRYGLAYFSREPPQFEAPQRRRASAPDWFWPSSGR